MKTYVFKLSDSRSGNVYRFAATAPNQSEAAQIVSAHIGGHSFTTRLDYIREYDSPRKAESAGQVTFCN